jgi:hypothetical protein
MFELADQFNLVPETVFLAVNYVDRFLSIKNVPQHRLQLLGTTAAFIASKYEEVSPLTLDDLVDNACDATPEDIMAMEICMLNVLVRTKHHQSFITWVEI